MSQKRIGNEARPAVAWTLNQSPQVPANYACPCATNGSDQQKEILTRSFYSYLNATIGSTCIALRAGM